MTSIAKCEADADLQPCLCYNTCPLGPSYYPNFDEWQIWDLGNPEMAKIDDRKYTELSPALKSGGNLTFSSKHSSKCCVDPTLDHGVSDGDNADAKINSYWASISPAAADEWVQVTFDTEKVV